MLFFKAIKRLDFNLLRSPDITVDTFVKVPSNRNSMLISGHATPPGSDTIFYVVFLEFIATWK